MKKNCIAIFILVLVLSSLLSSTPINRIVATVNGVGINYSNLKEYAKPYVEMGRIRDNKEGMLEMLNVMITEELMFQIYEENGVNVDDEYIDKLIMALKSKFNTDNISTILRIIDVPSEYVLRRRLKLDAGVLSMIKKVEEGEKLSFVVEKPSNEDVIKYYNQNYDELYSPREERQISHILITSDGDSEKLAKAKKQLENIVLKIKKQQSNFYQSAKYYSHDYFTKSKGGELGYFNKRELNNFYPEYSQVAFSLKKDEISDIIELDEAVAIIKVIDIRMGEAKSFGEVEDQIYSKFLKENFYEVFGKYLEKYREEAIIEIKY